MTATAQILSQTLLGLDQHSYKAYQAIKRQYQFDGFLLLVDHVQGDPFAAPSRMRLQIPQTEAGFPKLLYQSPHPLLQTQRSREIALRDYLNRRFEQAATQIQSRRGSGNSGLISISHPSQQVLERSAVWVNNQQIEVRFNVGLPARGRTILGRQATELLCQDLPEIVAQALIYRALDAENLRQHVETVEDADWLRQQLAIHNLVAFIPNGAILPRRSGIDQLPLLEAVPFQTPTALQVEFNRPNQGSVCGMGIPQGITLIVGGGYHGKSTLLQAIALGIYNHIPQDGREQVVANSTAIKIRAEEGRSIVGVNISPFINHLPQGRSTAQFCSTNASGSTSQAANIIEALEVGAKLLLVDEDTSATNFMIRDRRMQALIAKAQEPITPFIDKIRQLYQEQKVSTILVMGGSGDYFDVADTVIAMTEYIPTDVTAQAKQIAQAYATERMQEGGKAFGTITSRIPAAFHLESERSRLKVRELDELMIGRTAINLSAVEQLVEVGQLRAIGAAIGTTLAEMLHSSMSLSELVDYLMHQVEQETLDRLTPYFQGDLAEFRALELAAVVNRLRTLEIR
jgi:predicted ABC-class ATPase